jgi:Right handed beta helix region
MTRCPRRSITIFLTLTQMITISLGVGLPARVAGAAADTNPPKIVAASMRDADGDGKADRLVLTYNEKIRHSADDDGSYPFSLSDPTYGIHKVDSAQGTKKLLIRLKEKATLDPEARPNVSYKRGRPKPVKDAAGNEAVERTFRTTMPLPCAENTSTDFYANPVVKRVATPAPTGTDFPSWCAFPTITAALDALANSGNPGRVVTSGAGTTPATFRKETFPLTVPTDAALTTEDDPDLGGPGLDPTKYVVRFRGTASTAVELSGGTVKGITFQNAHAANASEMVSCDAAGSVLTGVALDGASSAGGVMTRGLIARDLCILTDGLSTSPTLAPLGLRVRNFDATGVEVANGGQLTLFSSKVHDNGGDGFWIRGIASLVGGEIAFNGDDGLFLDEAEPSSFIDLEVRNNVSNGFEIHSSALTSFSLNHIYNNAQSTGVPFAGQQPQLLFSGPTTPGSGVYVQTASDCLYAYPIGYGHVDECTPEDGPTGDTSDEAGCPSNLNNVINGYNINDAIDQTVGIRAIDSAFVNADFNTWASSTSSQNVSQGAGSFVKAEQTCGVQFNPGDTSGEPVDYDG